MNVRKSDQKQGVSKSFNIEPASWRDVLGIHRLSRLCFGEYAWPWIDVLYALSSSSSVRLKALAAEEVVGFVIGDQRSEEEGWIASIAVHPDYRRQGLGNRLMTLVEGQLKRPVIRLTLRRSNEGALALYRQRGYRQLDVWESYYHGEEDALVMEKWIERS